MLGNHINHMLEFNVNNLLVAISFINWIYIFEIRCIYLCILCNVYKISGRSASVYTDTSASHEYLGTLKQNGHEFCKLLIKRPKTVTFSYYIYENWEKILCNSGRFRVSVYRH